MKIPAGRKEVRISVSMYDLEGPVSSLVDRIREVIGDRECKDAVLRPLDWGWEETNWEVVGTRAATPKEIARSERASQRAKEAAAKRKAAAEAAERAEYERLQKKFG